MKKLLPLLLALCMLLPSAALADAVTYRFEMQIGEEAYRGVLAEAVQQNLGDSADQEEIIDAVAELVCGILDVASVEYTVQDNGLEFAVLLQDERLVSAAVTLEGSELLVSTSLLRDTVLVLDLADAMETVAAVDWDALADALGSTASEWYLTRDIAYEVSGNFAGSAYENGNERIVISLDDADIALLVEGLLLEIERSDLMTALSDIFGAEAMAAAVREIRAFNYDAALKNEFDYELSIVQRTEGFASEFVGASLNVLQSGEEAWSLSVGGEGESYRVIAAFHVDGMTNYFAVSQDVEAVSSKEETRTSVVAVYQAGQGASYAEASADPSKALLYNEAVMTVETSGTPSHYRRTMKGEERSSTMGIETSAIRFEGTEEYAASPFAHASESKVYMDDSTEAMVVYRVNAAEAAAFAHPENARRISIAELAVNTALQDEIGTAIMETGVAEMGVIAMQNIPAELLMLIMQLAQ